MSPEKSSKSSLKEENNIITVDKPSELHEFLSKLFPIFKKIKVTKSIVPVYFFFYAFGITFFISLLLFDIPLNIPVNFYYAETGELTTFNFPLGDLISVIMFGGVFSLSALRSFELLRDRVDIKKKSYAKRLFVVFLYVFFMIILIIGVFSHMISNQLNEFIHQIESSIEINEGTPLASLKSGIYLWDELISHIFIGFGYFGMLYVNTYLDFNSESTPRLNKIETVSLWIYGTILGFGNAIGFIEGQSALIFCVFSLILIISIIYVIKKNKLKFRDNVFVLCSMISSVSYIITIIVYMIVVPLKGYYPFLCQLSESCFPF